MKKLLLMFTALLLTVVVTACGNKENSSVDKLEAIKSKGKLVMGVSPDYPPYEFLMTENGKQKIVGADIFLAEEIAKALGVELELQEMQFDALLPALKSGRIDLVISGMSASEERKQVVDFSNNYYTGGSSFIVQKGTEEIKSLDDLKTKKIGVQKGTVQEKFLLEVLKMDQSSIQSLGDVPSVLQDLKNKNIDVVFLAEDVSQISISKEESLEISKFTLENDVESEGVAVAFDKGSNEKLTTEVNKVIDGIVAKDEFKAKLKEYGEIAVSQIQ